MEDLTNNDDIKLITNEARGNYLFLQQNYHTTRISFKKCMSHGNEKNTNIND